jgi:hypothetical protein
VRLHRTQRFDHLGGTMSVQYVAAYTTSGSGGGTADGTTVDLYTCNNTGAQVFIPQSNGSLYNPQSNKCLDDTNWSTTPGTQLQIWDCSGNANQKWALP